MFVCSYNDQDHFAYLDANGNIQDCWYDGSRATWKLQQINRGNGPSVPAEYVATNGPAVAGDLFVSVYNGQQHFTYRDQNGNLQDAWYGGGAWHLQQINDANGPAPPSPASTSPPRRQPPPPRNEIGELHQVATEINPPGKVNANNNMTTGEARPGPPPVVRPPDRMQPDEGGDDGNISRAPLPDGVPTRAAASAAEPRGPVHPRRVTPIAAWGSSRSPGRYSARARRNFPVCSVASAASGVPSRSG